MKAYRVSPITMIHDYDDDDDDDDDDDSFVEALEEDTCPAD